MEAAEHALGPVEQVPVGEGRVFTVQGHDIAVFRTRNAGILAVQAYCPHLGGPLADGLVGGTTVVCPLHSRKFDLVSGEGISNDCKLEVYSVRVSDCGDMWLIL